MVSSADAPANSINRNLVSTDSVGPIVFVWDNFGPMHVDRCEAVAEHFTSRRAVIGIELSAVSDVYQWTPSKIVGFRKITLFPELSFERSTLWRCFNRLLKTCLSQSRADYFFCHYERPEIYLTAVILRLLGRRVFVMNDSKLDDKPRMIWREMAKSIAFWPYCGALVSGKRAKEYMEFLHFAESRTVSGYDTLSLRRIRALAETDPAPGGWPFETRHFTVVARMVPKKNIPIVLEAYAIYATSVANPRPLHLCGSGELEAALRKQVVNLNLQGLIIFRGFIQSEEIAKTLAQTLVLILMSVEEQFGLAVIEAHAMGVPVIFSAACGARDELLRTAVNGFLVEADNPAGLAYFMRLIATNEVLWRRLAQGALQAAPRGDVSRFVDAVELLSSMTGRC